jgi:hypothetical protein
MPMCIVNGRRMEYSSTATPEEIASVAGIRPGRRIIKQTRGANYPMKPGERVTLQDGDKFVDAPPRVKGASL